MTSGNFPNDSKGSNSHNPFQAPSSQPHTQFGANTGVGGYSTPQPDSQNAANPFAQPNQTPASTPANPVAQPNSVPETAAANQFQTGTNQYPGAVPPPGTQPFSAQVNLPRTDRTNSLAVASLALSLLGLFLGITAPIGAILGHVALGQINRTGEQGRGYALGGVILGWIITVVSVVVTIIGVLIVFAALNNPQEYGIDPSTMESLIEESADFDTTSAWLQSLVVQPSYLA